MLFIKLTVPPTVCNVHSFSVLEYTNMQTSVLIPPEGNLEQLVVNKNTVTYKQMDNTRELNVEESKIYINKLDNTIKRQICQEKDIK